MNGNSSVGATYQSRALWNHEKPHALVVACSDGRLQDNLDEFLQTYLNLSRYDRLYAPGGPGALAPSGVEFLRSDTFRRECLFLVEAHHVEDVVLVFHGPSDDGPDEAVCADYKRIFPRLTAREIRAQQEKDLAEILRTGFGYKQPVRVHVFRCEVTGSGAIQFVEMARPISVNQPPSVSAAATFPAR